MSCLVSVGGDTLLFLLVWETALQGKLRQRYRLPTVCLCLPFMLQFPFMPVKKSVESHGATTITDGSESAKPERLWWPVVLHYANWKIWTPHARLFLPLHYSEADLWPFRSKMWWMFTVFTFWDFCLSFCHDGQIHSRVLTKNRSPWSTFDLTAVQPATIPRGYLSRMCSASLWAFLRYYGYSCHTIHVMKRNDVAIVFSGLSVLSSR